MKRTLVDSILFFLAMNFIGILTAIGVMIFLGKLNVGKLKEMRSFALDEVVTIKPEKIKEYQQMDPGAAALSGCLLFAVLLFQLKKY